MYLDKDINEQPGGAVRGFLLIVKRCFWQHGVALSVRVVDKDDFCCDRKTFETHTDFYMATFTKRVYKYIRIFIFSITMLSSVTQVHRHVYNRL